MEIDDYNWFHSIPLPNGDTTPGTHRETYHQRKAAILPDDFTGKSVLDVGAYDGYYSYEAERRGAEKVVAVDNDFEIEKHELLKEILDSDVEYRLGDVFEMDFSESFDVVLCMGVLYHVPDPEALLDRLAELTSDTLCASTIIVASPLNKSYLFDSQTGNTVGENVRYNRIWPRIYSRLMWMDKYVPTARWVDEQLEARGFETVQKEPFTTPFVHDKPFGKHIPAPHRILPVGTRYGVRAQY